MHLTTGNGASRSAATRPSSSTGNRMVPATWSIGCAPTTKLTGSRLPADALAS
jgi:hypothetical protein